MTNEVEGILDEVKKLASRYKDITGKAFGITGEVAEVSAARLLDLTLSAAREPGYDAVDRDGRKIQIKGRCISDIKKPGQRLGSIRLSHDWDVVILVLMNEQYDVVEIWEANRTNIEQAIIKPGSKARNERGALPVNQFKRIGCKIWPAETV